MRTAEIVNDVIGNGDLTSLGVGLSPDFAQEKGPLSFPHGPHGDKHLGWL